MSNEIKPGDTIYSQHGEEGVLVAASGGAYIVRPIFVDEDGPQEGDIVTWGKVFRTPPAPKLDAETADAEARLQKLRKELSEMQSQRYAFDREEKARIDRLKQHEELECLDQWLCGQVTHYVAISQYGFGVKIIPVGETIENYSSPYGYGLLTLQAYQSHQTNGIRWTVYYRDKKRHYNSDAVTERVFLCCGEDAAKAKAAEIVKAAVDKQMALPHEKRSDLDRIIQHANNYGIPVPQELADSLKLLTTKHIQGYIDQKTKELQTLQEQLAALA